MKLKKAMVPQWVEYQGMQKQLEDLMNSVNSGNGFITVEEGVVWGKQDIFNLEQLEGLFHKNSKFFICSEKSLPTILPRQNHPLMEMIKRQAKTGQPVWVYQPQGYLSKCTVEPDWNQPGMEYSFYE